MLKRLEQQFLKRHFSNPRFLKRVNVSIYYLFIESIKIKIKILIEKRLVPWMKNRDQLEQKKLEKDTNLMNCRQ